MIFSIASRPLRILSIAFAATSFLSLSLGACKKNEIAQSEVSAITQLGTESIDLTKYKGANEAVYTDMKKEVGMMINGGYAELEKKTAKLKPKGSMTREEMVALRLYTSKAYSTINTQLRTKNTRSLMSMNSLIKTAASGLNKIPATKCTTRRGLDLPEKTLQTILQVKRFEELAFMSTTAARSLPPQFAKKNLQFIIQSDNCHNIAWLSEYPSEKEVLFAPGAEFVVTKTDLKVVKGESTGDIYLDHIEAREPGFKEVTTGSKRNIFKLLTGALKNYPPLAKARAARPPAKLMGLTDNTAVTEEIADAVLEDDTLIDLSEVNEIENDEPAGE